jgi:alkylation response protein AidB-like acyl-CoA dehydrogenase
MSASLNLHGDEIGIELAELSRQVLARAFPPDRARTAHDAAKGHDERLWAALAESGAFGLVVPERHGGAGLGLVEAGTVLREAGRVAAPESVFRGLYASSLLVRFGRGSQLDRLLPEVADGTVRATVLDGGELEDTTAADGSVGLDGMVRLAHAAVDADLLLIRTRGRMHAVPHDAPGLALQPRSIMGGGGARADLVDVRVAAEDVLSIDDPIADAIGRALSAAEMLGGAEQVVARTADYINGREQFGRPIGTFQAAQHLIADRVIATTASDPVVLRALWLLDRERPATEAAAVAILAAGAAFADATIWGHQLHGGMGFARETNLFLWTERAAALRARFGGPANARAAIADHLWPPLASDGA